MGKTKNGRENIRRESDLFKIRVRILQIGNTAQEKRPNVNSSLALRPLDSAVASPRESLTEEALSLC